MEKITRAGAYEEIDPETYHGDLCDKPSISSSGLRKLLTTCPRGWWWNSYLNPERPDDSSKRGDLGTAAHLVVLEPYEFAKRAAPIDARDYRTNVAKDARDEARAAGRVPVLTADFERLEQMRDALWQHDEAAEILARSKTEVSLVWRRDGEESIWRKARHDLVSVGTQSIAVADYKTTGSVAREDWQRRVWQGGYHQQAAWYLDAATAVHGAKAATFKFICQEITPPYLVAVYELGPQAIQWGDLQNQRAVEIFRSCVERNDWPGYSGAEVIELPSGAEFTLEQQLENGDLDSSALIGKAVASAF